MTTVSSLWMIDHDFVNWWNIHSIKHFAFWSHRSTSKPIRVINNFIVVWNFKWIWVLIIAIDILSIIPGFTYSLLVLDVYYDKVIINIRLYNHQLLILLFRILIWVLNNIVYLLHQCIISMFKIHIILYFCFNNLVKNILFLVLFMVT